MTRRKTGARRESSASAGFTSPVVIQLWLILAALGILLSLLPSNFARLTALGLLVSAALMLVLRARRDIIHKGDQVEVMTERRGLRGRRGIVVDVLEFASYYKVELHETEAQGEMIPSDTVELSRWELKKHRG